MTQLKTLTPFKHVCMTIGNLPSSYVDSMSYYECLLWLCKFLQDEVIPTVNNNSEVVEELQEFVTTYFDNLDIQQEVNKKLDIMASDGTLTNLVMTYIQPTIDNQNAKINSMENKINSAVSGSPSGVYQTLNELETDDPDHSRIYVVSENGNWYYYDTETTSWESGGVYQAVKIADGSVLPKNTNFILSDSKNKFIFDNIVAENNVAFNYNYETYETTISGTANRNFRQLLFTIDFTEAGTYSLRKFDYSGTGCALYIYDQEHYQSQAWGTYAGIMTASGYGGNITVSTPGKFYVVAYTTNNTIYSFKGKITLLPGAYTTVTSFVPVKYKIANFINVKLTDNNYWNGKNMVCYGDSLTARGVYWRNQLATKYGLNVQNYGLTGSTASANNKVDPSTNGCSDERLNNLPANADIVTILFGTNDYSKNVVLGEVPEKFDTGDVFDTDTYVGGMLKIIQTMYQKYPTATIILLTPPWNHYLKNGKNNTIVEYGNIVKEIGKLTGCEVVDLMGTMNVNVLNYSNYSSDGIHFNDNGYAKFAEGLSEVIEKNVPLNYR